MKNILNYYYSLYPTEILHKDDKYFFDYLECKYVFTPFKRPISDINCLYKINRQMISREILVHEIIINKENEVVTYVNNIPYVLMELYVNIELRISLPEVCYINNNSVGIECEKLLNRYDWTSLWETKNDYFEAQINEIGKKYPNLCSYANYYIGLAENAILYVKEANKINDLALTSICHKRIDSKNNLFELYNPLNYIYDYRVRDVCEYVKSSFFNGEDAYEIVKEYFNNNYISYKEALLFYGRLLYPSYFFDLYDDIVNNELTEDLAQSIALKSKDYEVFLINVHLFLLKLYKRYIPSVDWLIKRN